MTAVAPIGVVGATGGVGRVAVASLRAMGVGPLREGGRREGGRLEGWRVDVRDPDSLARFCAGCAVVLNCAGPACDIGDLVARAAAAAGAHYVDPAGDDGLYDMVAETWPDTGAVGVLSAGMMPGLTGLLPRYLAATARVGPADLVAYVGGRDSFTPGAAADYLAVDGGFGTPMVAWRGGRIASAGRAPMTEQALPFFPERVIAQPYLSTETVRLAGELKLDNVRWFTVFAGAHVLAALHLIASAPAEVRADSVRRLCRAAELDLFGHRAYQLLVVECAGPGGAAARTLALFGTGASALTGTVAALATVEVWRGRVPPGLHHACEVLDPVTAVEALARTPAVTAMTVVDGTADVMGRPEEDLI
jgi:hypothetical protein